MSLRQTLGKIGLGVAVFLIVSPAILFFIWMISLSIKFEIDNASYPPILIPDRFAWQNYADVLASNRFMTYFMNTLIVTGSAIGDNSRPGTASGEVRAWDARTGALRWTFDPIPQDSTDRVYAGGGSKTLITTAGSVAAGYTGSVALGVQI